MINNLGHDVPTAIQLPGGNDTTLVLHATADPVAGAVSVTYTIDGPTGVTFSDGTTSASTPSAPVGTDDTPIRFPATFTIPPTTKIIFVTAAVSEIGGDLSTFSEPFSISVFPPAAKDSSANDSAKAEPTFDAPKVDKPKSLFQRLLLAATSFFGAAAAMLALTSIVACHELTDLPPTSAGVLDLKPTDTTYLVDGTSLITIRAQVDTFLKPLAKVDFTTSRGSFFPSGTLASVLPNDSGYARVQLKSSADSGVAIISATSGAITRAISISVYPRVNGGVRKLTTDVTSALADGATVVNVRVDVDTLIKPVGKVDFTTTLGAFAGGTALLSVLPNDSGIARAQLKPPTDAGIAIIGATASAITRTTSVSFVVAPPQSVQLSSDSFVIKPGFVNSIGLTAVLSRATGTPSPGTTVTFYADTGKQRIGNFGQFTTKTIVATSASVSTKFTAGATALATYSGPITIWTVARRESIVVAMDSISVPVVAP